MTLLNSIFEIIVPTYIMLLVILGIAQPIGAIIRLLVTDKHYSMYAIGLKRYLLSVGVYFTVAFLLYSSFKLPNEFRMAYLFLVPAFFAIWYIRHIWKWHKKWKNIRAFDRSLRLHASGLMPTTELDIFDKNMINASRKNTKRSTKIKSLTKRA